MIVKFKHILLVATYSKGWSVTPDAQFDDGILDFAVSKRSDFIAFTKNRKVSRIFETSRW